MRFGNVSLSIYFSILWLVELALYDIVWYGPHMVAVFTSCQYIYIYICVCVCVDHGLEGKLMLYECVVMMITLCKACLVFYSSL